MPIALKPVEIGSQFESRTSVLIVPCRVCPRMCLAVEQGRPLIDVTAGHRNDFFTKHLDDVKKSLEKRGVRATIFSPPTPFPMMCLWPDRLRGRLAKEAKKHDAFAVIGCESAWATVRDAVDLADDAVVQLMKNEGIANFIVSFKLPCVIGLAASTRGTVHWPVDKT